MPDWIERAEMHHSAEFIWNQSNDFWDIVIFQIFQMAVAMLDFNQVLLNVIWEERIALPQLLNKVAID